MMDIKVSVVLPTYNRPDLLPRAIDSVLNQTYRSFELIIVDDSSETNTQQVVGEYDDCRIRYVEHKENQGGAAARNTGINRATGDYIAFLDDDDEWRPTKLEKQVSAIEQQPSDVGLVYCWMNYYAQSGELKRKYHPTYQGYVFPHVLDGQRIGGCPTLLVRREVVQEVNGFDEAVYRGHDGDFIRRVCKEYKVTCVSEVLVNVYVDHGHDRISTNNRYDVKHEINAHKTKLRKFKTELESYPVRTANIYSDMAYLYAKIGHFRKCATYYKKSIKISPDSIFIYQKVLLTIIMIILSINGKNSTCDRIFYYLSDINPCVSDGSDC
jgi:glycosyltransferase involved in cell wall biosynthesis